MSQTPDIITRVRRALGRSEPLKMPPIPPAIDEPITRLVHSDIGLSELFASRAQLNGMGVELLRPEEVLERLVTFLRENQCRRLALSRSPLLETLGVEQLLRDSGFEVRLWNEVTLDELYDFDCGITDVYAAVAETGSLVIRDSAEHGRALSLVPPIHVAILEPKNMLPDLVDLFEKLPSAPPSGGTVLISGPSKTSDIEMTLVVGIHGPLKVQLFVLN